VTGTIVNPTGDVTVDDNLDAKKDVTITGKISNPTANPLEIADGVKVTGGDLDIWGALKNTFGAGGPVSVKNGLSVQGKISADYLTAQFVSNSVLFGGQGVPFQVKDDLSVSGKTTLAKDLSVTGKVTASGGLDVVGDLVLTNYLTMNGGFVSNKASAVNGFLQVTGGLTATEDASFKKNVYVTGNVDATGGFSAVGTSAVDSNGLSGLLMLGSTASTQRIAMDRDDICSYGTPLYLNYYTPNDVVIGAPNGGSDLDVNGKVTAKNGLAVTGDATVSGKVTATGKITSTTGIGKFTRQISAYSKITAGVGNFFETSVSCDGFGVIVSCGGQGSASSPGYTATGKVSFSNLDAFTDNKCYARGVNSGATDQYIAAIATCFDPTK